MSENLRDTSHLTSKDPLQIDNQKWSRLAALRWNFCKLAAVERHFNSKSMARSQEESGKVTEVQSHHRQSHHFIPAIKYVIPFQATPFNENHRVHDAEILPDL
jgi:hypothetical protein